MIGPSMAAHFYAVQRSLAQVAGAKSATSKAAAAAPGAEAITTCAVPKPQ